MARLLDIVTVESTVPTVSSVNRSLAGLNISNPVGGQSEDELQLSELLNRSKKRRLATTRGFGFSYNQSQLQVDDIPTPGSSPSKFNPIIGSTPLLGNSPVGSHPAPRVRELPPRPPRQSPSLAPPPVPPRRSSSPLSIPGAGDSQVPGPVSCIRINVISPRDTPIQSLNSSAPKSLDWDNFGESPSYGNPLDEPGVLGLHLAECLQEVEELTGLEDIKKITLVDTSESSLSLGNMSFAQQQFDNELALENEKLMDMQQRVLDMMEDYTADNVRVGNVELVSNELKDIANARAEFRVIVRKYRQKYSGSHPSNCQRLDGYLGSLNQQVSDHADAVWTKVEQLKEQQSAALQVPPAAPVAPRVVTPNISQIDLDYKRKMFRDQLLYLTEALSLPDSGSVQECWKEKSEADVCQAMREISNWQRNLLTLCSSFRDYEKLSLQWGEDSTVYDGNAEDFEEIRSKVKEVTQAVRAEDEKRNLQTLLPTKSDKVKYPTFGGEPGEDLVRFKEKMLDCFKKNRVPESDQLDKVRENLKGAALKRVPQTLKKTSVAWQNLYEAFGSPMIVLKERLKSLTKLGPIPPDSNAGKQITWYHDFESVVQDIIDLGTTDDMNMQMGAFGPQVQEQVLKALIDNPQKKREVAMSGHERQPREKIIAYRDKIISYRRETQLAEVESGTVSERKNPKSTAPGNSANYTAPDPARNDDCKICKQIEDDNNPQKLVLFEKHIGGFPIHCPNFMKMKMKDRVKMVQKARMCIYCLHHDVVTDRGHETACKVKESKFSKNWKCDSPGCGKHSWICVTHSDNSNKKKLKFTAEKLLRKGLEFANPGILAFPAAGCEKVNTALEELEKQINKELVPTPDGQPMFLFFGAKGKTRKLMVFFDSGCSRFIMRDCVPGKELPASLVRRGPFPIGGVGDSTIFAADEYMVAMDTDDGKAQQVQGVTVKTITSKFPDIDITSAVSEVTLAAPNNRPLQRCKFPTSVGGEIDCLMGIQYNNLQPKLLHMLPSGLAVYKTKLSPHQQGYNYVLGGPHSSFDTMLARTGNGTYMMEQFIAGLANWRSLGPPSLTQYIMSEYEVIEATKKNFCDDDMSNYKELVEYEQQEFSMICNEMLGGLSEGLSDVSPETVEEVGSEDEIQESSPEVMLDKGTVEVMAKDVSEVPDRLSADLPLRFTRSAGKNEAPIFTSSAGKNDR